MRHHRGADLHVYVREDDALRCRASIYDGDVDQVWMAQDFSAERWTSTKLALHTGKPVVIRDLSDAAIGEAQRLSMKERGERSLLAVPLVAAGEAFGIVELVDRRERAYGHDELRAGRSDLWRRGTRHPQRRYVS